MKKEDFDDLQFGLSTIRATCERILPEAKVHKNIRVLGSLWANYWVRTWVWIVQTILMVLTLFGSLSWGVTSLAFVLGLLLSLCYSYIRSKRNKAIRQVARHISMQYDVNITAEYIEVVAVSKWKILEYFPEPGWPSSLGRHRINTFMKEGL
jgi:hypothetical protein